MKFEDDDIVELFNPDRYYKKCPGEWIQAERRYNSCYFGEVSIDKVVGKTPTGRDKHKTVNEVCSYCKGKGVILNSLGERLRDAMKELTNRGFYE